MSSMKCAVSCSHQLGEWQNAGVSHQGQKQLPIYLGLRLESHIPRTPSGLHKPGQLVTLTGLSSFLCFGCSPAGTQDSPINKLLYARDIPRYKRMVERYEGRELGLEDNQWMDGWVFTAEAPGVGLGG